MFSPSFSPLQQFGVQLDRAQQVNELLVAQPMCRATNPDRSILEVGMRLQDGTLTSLRITLPPNFPTEAPALCITSPVRHPWVDRVGFLSFPLLDRWGQPNVRLAAVVADAFKGLGGTPATAPVKPARPGASSSSGGGDGSHPGQQQQQPPAPGPQQQQQHPPPQAGPSGRLSMDGSGGMATAGSGSSSRPSGPAGGEGSPPRRPVTNRVMPIPSSFAEVAQMSDDQLSHTLADEAAYRRLVDQIAQSLNLWQVVEQLQAETREAAAANLALGDQMADIRNQMAIIRSSEYAPAKAAFDAKWARQQAVLSKLSPEVLLRRLQEGVKEAEDEGEQVLQQLAGGQLGVEAFVERYTKAQARYHQRDLKLQAAQQTLPQLGG